MCRGSLPNMGHLFKVGHGANEPRLGECEGGGKPQIPKKKGKDRRGKGGIMKYCATGATTVVLVQSDVCVPPHKGQGERGLLSESVTRAPGVTQTRIRTR